MARQQVREIHRRLVSCGVGGPQTPVSRDANVGDLHGRYVAGLFTNAAIRRCADGRIVNQRIVADLEKVRDTAQRRAVPIACRDRRRGATTTVSQLSHRVGGAQLKYFVVAGKQHGQCAVCLHQLMNDADCVRAQVARAAIYLRPPFTRADTTVLVDDTIRGRQREARR